MTSNDIMDIDSNAEMKQVEQNVNPNPSTSASTSSPSIASTSTEPTPPTLDTANSKSNPIKNKNNDKKKSPSKTKKSRKRTYSESIDPKDSNNNSNNSEPQKKKKKKGWSELEEKLFSEGLETFGRDWKLVANHVGHSRNAASIRSHAQVHFMRLLQHRKPLPAKILESGNGYTLGGAPLNKYSAVAKRHFGGDPNKVPMIDGVISDEEAANKLKRPGNKNKKGDKDKKPKAKKKKKKKKNKYYDSDSDEACNYAAIDDLSISKRTTTRRTCAKRRGCNDFGLHVTDPFGLRTDIEIYDDVIPIDGPESDDDNNTDNKRKKKKINYSKSLRVPQPFTIKYCPNSLVIADIHSHLCAEVEIMGLLGGSYDIQKRILWIKKCYPLHEELQGEQEVSADSFDHLRISNHIRDVDKLEVVGWYHSHPCFDNYPSNTDIQQHCVHKYEEDESIKPYVGLIISSWSTNNINGHSHYRFFNSIKEEGHDNYIPYEFKVDTKIYRNIVTKTNDDKNDDNSLLNDIKDIITRYINSKYDLFRTNLGEEWQSDLISTRNKNKKKKDNKDGNNDDDDDDFIMSRGNKILQSIEKHIIHDGDKNEIKQFINKINKIFTDNSSIWWLTNKPNDCEIDNEVKENKNTLNDNN